MHADEGRWDCKQLVTNLTYMPTLHNAKSIETWDKHYGHVESSCKTKNKRPSFRLGPCAVNCYSQWFSGLSCPEFNTTAVEQYKAAKATLLRYK